MLRQWWLSAEARRISAGCGSHQVLQAGACDCRSPFERSPFEKAFSSMLKGKVSADCSLAGPPSSSAGTTGGPGSSLGTSSIPEDGVAPGRSAARALRFNDSAHDGERSPQHCSAAPFLHSVRPNSSMGFTAELECTTDSVSSLAHMKIMKYAVCPRLARQYPDRWHFAFCAVAERHGDCEWYSGAQPCATRRYQWEVS